MILFLFFQLYKAYCWKGEKKKKEKKNIPKYIASTKESHLWNLLWQLNCEDHCWRGYKWSLGHFVPFVQRSNSSWWGIKNFSKDYYGLEGFEISVILEKFIVCSLDQSELCVYWAADSWPRAHCSENEHTELDFQVHKVNKHAEISQTDPQSIAEKGMDFWVQANTDMWSWILLSLGKFESHPVSRWNKLQLKKVTQKKTMKMWKYWVFAPVSL